MTYLSVETSTSGARPVELYKFANAGSIWGFCTGEENVTHDGVVYQATTISRGGTEASQEFGKSQLSITIPYDNLIARLFASATPSGFVTVTVLRSHLDDTEWITHWRGRVTSASWRDVDCTLRCEPIFTSLQRIGLRDVYQLQCRHILYSPRCGITQASRAVTGQVSMVIGAQVQIAVAAGQPNGFYTGGVIAAPSGSRTIYQHSETSLLMISPLPGLQGGQTVSIYPGCDHTLTTCAAKFLNHLNYGGQPWIPQKNPFTGDAII